MIKIYPNKEQNGIYINWQLSKYCNKKCHYCTSFDWAIRGKDIDPVWSDEELRLHDNIADILPKLVKSGNIQLYGGEPTLHPKGIAYFNKFCFETKDNPNVTTFLVTHGDIPEEKILSINTYRKKDHVISISYHHFQVNFDDWFKKIMVWHEHTNAIVAAIIPRQSKVWPVFERNIRSLIDAGVPVDLKSQLDNVTLESDEIGLKRFSELYDETVEKRGEFYNRYFVDTLFFDDGVIKKEIKDLETLNGIPIIKQKTMCVNKQFGITDDVFGYACGEGKSIKLNPDTTLDDMKSFVDSQPTILCCRTHCCENRHLPSKMTILGRDLNDRVYKEFLDKIL